MSVPSFIYSEHFKIQISYYGLEDLASVFFSKLCSLLLFQIHWPLSKLHQTHFFLWPLLAVSSKWNVLSTDVLKVWFLTILRSLVNCQQIREASMITLPKYLHPFIYLYFLLTTTWYYTVLFVYCLAPIRECKLHEVKRFIYFVHHWIHHG